MKSSAPIDYQFRITKTTDAPLPFGTQVDGSLDPNTAADVYSFSGTAGEHVAFQSTSQSNGYNGAYWTLYGPNNHAITGNWLGSDLFATLPADGSYTLVIANNSGEGPSTYSFEAFVSVAPTNALTLDTEVTGTIADPGDSHSYTFHGDAGQTLYFDGLESDRGLDAYLYDPNGNQVFNNFYNGIGSDVAPATLTFTGTYTLTIYGGSYYANYGYTGSYDFILSDTAKAASLPLNTPVTGTLATGLTTNLYQFTGSAGEVIFFQGLADAPSNGAQAYLYNPANSQITNFWIENDSQVTLPFSGTYLLAVAGTGNASGSVSYSFEAFVSVAPTDALTLGTEVTGTIADPGDSHSYTFHGDAGQTLYFDGLGSDRGLDAYLYDPNGTQVFNNFYNGIGSDVAPVTLTFTGTYTLTIYGGSFYANYGYTGSYDFILSDTAKAAALPLDTPVTGTLATGLTTDLYQFTGSAGEVIFFQGLADAPSNGAQAYLYNPANSQITNFWIENDSQVTLPFSGTYLLAVAGTGNASGSVGYSFEAFVNIAPTNALTLGTEVTGTIADPGDSHSYTFHGDAGQTLYFDGLESDRGLDAYLYDPNGTQVFNNFYNGIGSDVGPVTLTFTGTYTLTVYGGSFYANYGYTGSYDFILSDTAATLPLDTPVTGTLATGLTTDLYQFTGSAGEVIFFQGLADSPSNGAQSTLYNPANSSITNFWIENDSQVTLPFSGTYLLAIAGTGNASGSVGYSFEAFVNIAPTNALTLGTEVTGEIVNPGDSHTYTFHGDAGQTIYFDGLASGPGLYAVLSDPHGNQIFSSYYRGISSDEGPVTLMWTGTYTVTVYGGAYYGSNGYTGNYDFFLSDASKATSLSLGTVLNGGLATGLSTNLYQFNGTAGEVIFFQGQSDTPANGAQATLYNPANNSIVNFWIENNSQITLPYTGTYILAVAGTNAGNSSVSYRFEAFQNVDPTTELTLNSEATGTIQNPGDSASYTFTGSAGQQVQFNGLTPGSSLYAVLTDPEGNTVFIGAYWWQGGSLGSNAGPFTLSVAGTYTLTILGDGAATGDYDFRLLDLASEPVLQVGTTEAVLTVTLSEASAEQVRIDYATADDTATAAGGDYIPMSGVLLFQPGQTTATIAVQAIDQVTTTATDFDVTLSNPIGGTIAQATGVVTIEPNGIGTLEGQVFNDENGNGTLDGGEPGLSGWTIDLLDIANDVMAAATTDSNGDYTFTGVAPGSYTVAEVVNGGWDQTSPATPVTYSVTISSAQTIMNLNFGDFQTVTISGQAYNDVTGSGSFAAGDSGLSGWTINLLNTSTNDIVSITTDANGDFSFMGVGPGTYSVEEVTQTGYVQTSAPFSSSLKTFSGQNINGQLFGDFQLATIQGEVFSDRNDDGALDAGDPGLTGWTVQLLNSDSQVVATTSTDASGDYTFDEIGPGSYSIQDVQQSGYVPTTAVSLTVTVTSGLVSTGNDFGQFLVPTLTGEVFNDLNGDGQIENGEPELAGVTVQLLNGAAEVIATTITDSSGDYTFTLSSAGTYSVAEVVSSGAILTVPASGSYTETPGAGQSVANLDFGDFQSVSLSGTVYNDINGNGTLDGGEPRLSGWKVNLLNGSNQILGTTTTDSQGNYQFSGVGPGTYSVEVVQQTGYVLSSIPAVYSETTISGHNNSNLSFGEFQAVTLGGEVFIDLSGDGTLETGDGGLSGWTVNLVNGANQSISTTTDANGDYSFSDVGPGTYTIAVSPQAGYATTTVASYTQSTTGGVDVSGFDFGEFQTVTVSGEVFNDPNDSGKFVSGDTGLSGWTVNLVQGSQVVQTTSGLDGVFSFSNVGPGSWTLEAVQQTGWVATNSTVVITPTSGTNISAGNLGEFQTITLSGQVFDDVAGSGTYASGDAGLAGWTIDLLNSANNVVDSAQTDPNGDYSLTGFGPGTYIIEEVPQNGYIQTTAQSFYSVTTVEGQDTTGLNFGDFQLATVGGEIFADLKDDGTLDPGDPGLAGWTVNLLSAGNIVATTIADTDGDYSLTGVGPGTYGVAEVLRPGYAQTAPASGGLTVTTSSGAAFTANDFGVVKTVALAVSGLATTPPSGLQSGSSLIVQWTDTNTGSLAASGSFTDQIVITNTTTGDDLATDYITYNAASRGDLGAGASATQQYDFRLPDGNAGVGQIQFTVTADYGQDVSTPDGEPNRTATLIETSKALPPAISSVAAPTPNPRNAPVNSVDVTFTEAIDLATFTTAALSLTDNGSSNLITGAVTISLVSGSTYQIGGLSGLTMAEGTYVLTVNAAGIRDQAGNFGTGMTSATWLMDTTPPTSTIGTLPTRTSMTSFLVSASGTDPNGSNGGAPSGIATFTLYVSKDGGAFTAFASVTPANPSAPFVGQPGHSYGFYGIATDNAGNVQPTPTAAQQTVQILPPLSISSIAAVSPNSRDTAVASIDVTFSEPINSINPGAGALTLTDNGGANLITSGVSLTLVEGDTYAIVGLAGLTEAQGNYTLTVNAADIQDQYGMPGTGTLSTSWRMDTTPPTSTVNPLTARGTSLTFAVSVTGSDGGNPPSGVASYDIYSATNGAKWTLWTNVPASNPTANFTGQSNTTYSFYSIAIDRAGNVENKTPAIEASTYLPDLTPPVTSVNGATGTNPSSVNTSTGTFTLDVTGSDPGGGIVTYFEVFVSVDSGPYTMVNGTAISAGPPDGQGNSHATIPYQGLTDGNSHTYQFYSIGIDSVGNVQSAPPTPNLVLTETFAQPSSLGVTNLIVENGAVERSYIRYLDIAFNQSDSQSGSELTQIADSIRMPSSDILIYKYDLNGDASSKTAVSLSNVDVAVIDHAIELDFGSNGLGGSPNSTAADGYYELDIKLPDGQTAVHHFYRLLGDVTGDGVVDQHDLNEVAAEIGLSSQSGMSPLDASVTGDGTVSALDLLLATRSKGRKLGSGLPLG